MTDPIPTTRPIPGTSNYWQPRVQRPETIVDEHNKEAAVPRERDVQRFAYQDWRPD